MARLRLPASAWHAGLLAIAVATTTAFLVDGVALAQVAPAGAIAEVRDASGVVLVSAAFREGRGEVLITMIFPSPPVITGTHGLRITSIGRCDTPDFQSAGAGFNPFNTKHGRKNPDGPQVGDLPNVNITTGLSSYNTSALGATLGPGMNSLLGSGGRALVIYSGEDDQVTDPDGNAGTRIGCGVISPATGAAGVAAQPTLPPTSGPVPAPTAPAQPAAPTLPAAPVSSPGVIPPPVVVQPSVVAAPTAGSPQTNAAPAVSAVPISTAPAASPTPISGAPAASATPTSVAPAATPASIVPAVSAPATPATIAPTAAPTPAPVAAPGVQIGGGMGRGPAVLIAVLGLGLVFAGYLLRRPIPPNV